MGTIPRPKGFSIEGKKHMKQLKNKFDMGFNEINHKIHMKVKKDYQAIISPLLQSMLGFRQAIFWGGGGGGGRGGVEYVSDWVADLKKGLNSLYVYCPLVEPTEKLSSECLIRYSTVPCYNDGFRPWK